MSPPRDVFCFDLKRRLRPLLQGVMLGSASTENLTVAWVEGAAGTRVPSHRHSQAQLTVILSGSVRVATPNNSYELGTGQAISIPPDILHEAEILAAAVYLDIFHPARHDLTGASFDYEKGNDQA